jgi:hypothetical protein
MKSKLAATIKYCAVLFSFIFSCGFTSCQKCYSERIEVSMPAMIERNGALQAPLRAGDVLAVNSAFDGGGWGTISLPAGVNAQVSVRADNFVATSASGSIQVLAVAPLRLRIDIETSDATNSTIRIRGDASFKYVRERVTCD